MASQGGGQTRRVGMPPSTRKTVPVVDAANGEAGGGPRSAPVVAGFANPRRGWERLYVDTVLQADTGADRDFLVGSSGSQVCRESH